VQGYVTYQVGMSNGDVLKVFAFVDANKSEPCKANKINPSKYWPKRFLIDDILGRCGDGEKELKNICLNICRHKVTAREIALQMI
jgi:hypothetical protein